MRQDTLLRHMQTWGDLDDLSNPETLMFIDEMIQKLQVDERIQQNSDLWYDTYRHKLEYEFRPYGFVNIKYGQIDWARLPTNLDYNLVCFIRIVRKDLNNIGIPRHDYRILNEKEISIVDSTSGLRVRRGLCPVVLDFNNRKSLVQLRMAV